MKQGDCIFPTIFSIFNNDLVSEIKDLDLGVDLNCVKIFLLLYLGVIFHEKSDFNHTTDALSRGGVVHWVGLFLN